MGAPNQFQDYDLDQTITLSARSLYDTIKQFNLINKKTENQNLGNTTFNPWLVEDGVFPEAKYYPETNELLVKYGLMTPPMYSYSNLFIVNFARLISVVATALEGGNVKNGVIKAKQAYSNYKTLHSEEREILDPAKIVAKWDSGNRTEGYINKTAIIRPRYLLQNLDQVFWITWAQTWCNIPQGNNIVNAAVQTNSEFESNWPDCKKKILKS